VQGTFTGKSIAEASKVVLSITVTDKKLAQAEREILAPLKHKTGYSPAWVTQSLQSLIIPNFVLYTDVMQLVNQRALFPVVSKNYLSNLLKN
jgi:hypothetical protein